MSAPKVIQDLEGPLCDVINMARILCDLLEEACPEISDERERELVSFASYQTVALAEKAREEWHSLAFPAGAAKQAGAA